MENIKGLQRLLFSAIVITFLFVTYYSKTRLRHVMHLLPLKAKWHVKESNKSGPDKKHFTERQNQTCKTPLNFTTIYPFHDVLVAINFNHPHYRNIEVLLLYYRPLFPKIVICGPERYPTVRHNVIVVEQQNEYGYYGFQCLVEAIRQNPGYAGYLYVNDDVIFNWWNLYKTNRSKIWYPISGYGERDMVLPPRTFFWQRAYTLERCIRVYNRMERDLKFVNMKAIEMYMENVKHKKVCVSCLSDIVYIPGRLAEKFKEIGQNFYDNRLFLEVSVPMALLMIEKRASIAQLDGVYLQAKYNDWGPWTGNTTRAWNNYNYDIHFLHPYKLSGQNEIKNTNEFKQRILKKSEAILKSKCLDIFDESKSWIKT